MRSLYSTIPRIDLGQQHQPKDTFGEGFTLPETNSEFSPENQWLVQMSFLLGKASWQVRTFIFREGNSQHGFSAATFNLGVNELKTFMEAGENHGFLDPKY